MKHIIFWCGILGALLFGTASIIGGLQIEGYNPIAQYISESYATGIPNSEYLQYAYMTSGILLFFFGLMAPKAFQKSKGIKIAFLLLAVFYGLGTFTTGFFPCDLGCPSEGTYISLSQFIHNTAGFLTYCTVPFCIIALGMSFGKIPKVRKLGKISLLCGIIALVFVVFLFSNPNGAFIGLFQRIIEVSILIWIFLCAFHILKATEE